MLFISNIVIIIAIVLIVILLFIIVNKLSKENLNNNLNFSELKDNYKNLNEKFTKIEEEIENFKINTEERELKFKHKILDGIIGGYKYTRSEDHFLKAKNEDELKKLYGIELEKDSYDGTFHTKIDKNSIKSFKTEIGEKFSIEKNNYHSSFYETRIIDTSHISLSGLYSGEVFLKKNDDFYKYENFKIEEEMPATLSIGNWINNGVTFGNISFTKDKKGKLVSQITINPSSQIKYQIMNHIYNLRNLDDGSGLVFNLTIKKNYGYGNLVSITDFGVSPIFSNFS